LLFDLIIDLFAVKLLPSVVSHPEPLVTQGVLSAMATDQIKDAKGAVLGSIESNPDGEQVLRDAQGKIKGYYDPTTDHTRGPDKRILAKGNVLRTLIC
jgi:hypothetical protein